MHSTASFLKEKAMNPKEMQVVSAVFSGYRPDRDVSRYYADLLNRLAETLNINLLVFTNEPSLFSERVQTITINDLKRYRQLVWNDKDWESTYHTNLGWHPKNRHLAQYRFDRLVEVYLSKLGLKVEAHRMVGDFLWLDAGLLNSVLGLNSDRFYSLQGFERLRDLWRGDHGELTALIDRKSRLLKNHRPSFHGLSFNDMSKVARACGATPDEHYVVGGTARVTQVMVAQIEKEASSVWEEVLKIGRAGTEENILSVLRWKHNWNGESLEMLVDVVTS